MARSLSSDSRAPTVAAVDSGSSPRRVESIIDYLLLLRGFAACGVVLSHICALGPHSLSAFVFRGTKSYDYLGYARDHSLPEIVLAALTPMDATSFVLLFFVLSGYLMGKVFFDGRYQAIGGLRRFYKARFLRLAPLLYFNLLVCVCLFSGADLDFLKLVGDFLFITNFTDRGVNAVTWSLSVEMQYYVICPFVYLLFRNPRRLSFCWAFLLALSFFVGQLTLSFMSYFSYIYAFVLGFAVNLCLFSFRPEIGEWKKRVLIVALIVPLHVSSGLLHFMGYNQASGASAVIFSSLLVYVAELPSAENNRQSACVRLVVRFFAFAGVLSYGIYLWHYVIIVTRFGDIDRWAMYIAKSLGLVGSWELMLMFNAVEIPVVFGLAIALAFTTFKTIETRFRPGLYER